MTVSTMVRAQETGSIIGEKLPELPKDHCSLLQEGAPYPPEPSSKLWTPDRSVCHQVFKETIAMTDVACLLEFEKSLI